MQRWPQQMKVDLYLAAAGAKFYAATYEMNLSESLARVVRYGYDGVELITENPRELRSQQIRELAESNGLEIVALSTGLVREKYGATFTDPSDNVRQAAVRMVKDMVSFASELEAPIVSIGLVRGMKRADLSEETAWQFIVSCLVECGKHAKDLGITLAVEPENRYEVGYIHTVKEAMTLVREVGLSSVKIMIDTFHMNIEEVSTTEPLREGAADLVHVHLADSNRRAPGMGHLDFVEIIETLREVGYGGYLGIEILPEPDADVAAEQAIAFVRRLL